MVRHEAVAQDGELMVSGFLCEQFEVDLVVGIAKEDLPTCITALRDMVANIWRDHAGETGHTVWWREDEKNLGVSSVYPGVPLPRLKASIVVAESSPQPPLFA